MINSKNSTVSQLIILFLHCHSSVFAENCRYLMYKYSIPLFLWHGDFNHILRLIIDSTEHSASICNTIATVEELCNIRDNVMYTDLRQNEVKLLIEAICIE